MAISHPKTDIGAYEADVRALGDFQALQATGRLAVRMNLPESKASIMERLLQS